jgi:N-methylhydantoinase B
MQVFYLADYGSEPSRVVLGGAPGSLAAIEKLEADGGAVTEPVIGDVEPSAGHWVRNVEAGGGGYGDPLDRDPEAVRLDVLDRWVSTQWAAEDYGAVLTGSASAGTLAVDQSATELLRVRIRSSR